MYLIRSILICSHKFFLNVFYSLCIVMVLSMNSEMLFVSSESKKMGSYTPVTNHTSGLCENYSLSCSNQVWLPNVSADSCRMIHHKNTSSVCHKLDGPKDTNEHYGKLILKAYPFQLGKTFYTAFNVSFKDIKWRSMRMSFSSTNKRPPSICREFQVSEEIASSLTLHFDCYWGDSDQSYDGQPYLFDYQVILSSGDKYFYKYLFYVPEADRLAEAESVTKWRMFIVMDISSAPVQLKLRIQTAPPIFNITRYKVEVLRTLKGNNAWAVQEVTLEINENDTDGILKYTYNTSKIFGEYKFNVTPLHKDCSGGKHDCSVVTPQYTIVEMAEPIFLTGIVAMVILIPILLMLYFMWKRNCDTTEPNREPTGPPKFLLMYKPVSVEHINTMMELCKYLKKCHLHAMIDQFGIAESETKDPVRWYSDAFKEADFVGIFASPVVAETDRQRAQKFNKYFNTEIIAQNHLSMSLCSPGAKCKFFSISLPGTQWDTLPIEAQALKRYTLPRDLDPLLVLIGVQPQCDRGAGFQKALEAARSSEVNFAFDTLPEPPLRKQSSPVPDEEVGPSTASGLKDDDTSLCLDTAISGSDMLSSRQYLSDEMSTPPSSLDQLSLLGESN